ncbi:MAG: HAD family hydrolase [Bacteroidales bacterium]|nr:HAD family hydrolase [Bacteroidales bacterium]
MIKQLIFDWGGTIMIDYAFKGPMYLWETVDWVPGAQQALSKLSTQYPLCIATNAPHSGTEEMIKALARVGAKEFFRNFFSSKELGYEKPDPRFFLAIAEKLNVDPAACLMVGNHYSKDIIGARMSGMKTVYYNEKQLSGPFEDADLVIDDMGELAEAVTLVNEDQ